MNRSVRTTRRRKSHVSEPLVDDRQLLEQVGGDAAQFEEIVALYRTERPKILVGLAQAIESGTAVDVEQEAQRLKGTFGSIAAGAAVRLAQQLETMARDGNLREARSAMESLEGMTRIIDQQLNSTLTRIKGQS
jgi:HPt (histidine-containing phosphotransfer) domain-containing protein